MVDQALPPWGDDPLSTFLSNAQWNERALGVNVPDLYALLQRVHGVFERVAAITEKESNEHLLPTRFLMARAHAAWLAAVRLGMSGQVVETYPLVRMVVENSWYALHLAKDSAPPTRAELWLRRSDDDAAESRCATEFSISNVRKTHAALDPSNERAMHEVYRRTIAFGGHPNERGVLSATTRMETDETYTSAVAQLTDRPLLITTALKATIEAAVGALRTEKLLNRDMRHARRRSRPMPVFLTGRNPHNVAFADLLGPTAPLPNPACASRQPS